MPQLDRKRNRQEGSANPEPSPPVRNFGRNATSLLGALDHARFPRSLSLRFRREPRLGGRPRRLLAHEALAELLLGTGGDVRLQLPQEFRIAEAVEDGTVVVGTGSSGTIVVGRSDSGTRNNNDR